MTDSNPWFPLYIVLRIRYAFGGLRGTQFDLNRRILRSCKIIHKYERVGKITSKESIYLIDAHNTIGTALNKGHIHFTMDSKVRTLLRIISNVISKVK